MLKLRKRIARFYLERAYKKLEIFQDCGEATIGAFVSVLQDVRKGYFILDGTELIANYPLDELKVNLRKAIKESE